MGLYLLTGAALATALAYGATPLAIRAAERFAFFDHPVGYKGHGSPTPYLGGAAVLAAFLLVTVTLRFETDRSLPFVGALVGLWVIGTIDDRRTVRPALRILAEVGAAAILWAAGMGWHAGAPSAVDFALTALWVVAVVNAFNLFDNMDGAATTMAAVAGLSVATLGVIAGDTWTTVAGAALAGACAGFLPFNLARPARIFLGDGGSMPLGFAVAALVMVGASGVVDGSSALLVGLLLVGVPALDTALVIISRSRRRISLLTGGRDHLTHRAHTMLDSPRAVALALAVAQSVVAVLAIVSAETRSSALIATIALYLVAVALTIVHLDFAFDRESGQLGAPPPALAAPARILRRAPAIVLVLTPLGVALGASSFWSGFYDSRDWAPIGLALLGLLSAALIAQRDRLTGPAIAAVAGLGGLAVWSLISTGWTTSVEDGLVDANRWTVYAVLLALLVVVLRARRHALVMLGAVVSGATIVAGWELGRLLLDNGATLFLGGRLNDPLGYINAQGDVFVVGFFGMLALAERSRVPWRAGAGAFGATCMGGLALLSQSRGVAISLLAALIVVLALVPGRLRRAAVLAVLGLSIIVAEPSLAAIYTQGNAGSLTDATVRHAGTVLVLCSLVVGVAWAVAVAAEARVSPRTVRSSRAVWTTVLIALAVTVTVGVLVRAADVRSELRTQYNAFVHLEASATPSGTTRLASGAGNRYDYWRIAGDVFRDHPIVGAGAGGYTVPYYRARATTEDIRQPHSIELETLSELGLVGAALLALLVGGVGWGAARSPRRAAASQLELGVTVAALGGFVTWLVHTSVDWMHLLPGVAGTALVCAAVLVRRPEPSVPAPTSPPQATHQPRGRGLVLPAMVVLLLLGGGLLLARQVLSEQYASDARSELTANPVAAVHDADRALRLDSAAVATWYTKAAALARLHQASASRVALLAAAHREPQNFLTYVLLGDLDVRLGDLAAAQADYRHAHVLNPRDAALAALAADPRTAAGSAGSGR